MNVRSAAKHLLEKLLQEDSLMEYVAHVPGHKNSKGEAAPWVIKSHETGKIISSHKTQAEAKSHLQDIHAHESFDPEAPVETYQAHGVTVEIHHVGESGGEGQDFIAYVDGEPIEATLGGSVEDVKAKLDAWVKSSLRLHQMAKSWD